MEKQIKILYSIVIALTLGILWSFHLYYEQQKNVNIDKRLSAIEVFLNNVIEANKKQQGAVNK